MSPTPANIVRGTEIAHGAAATIYTVPATGKFYLTNASLNSAHAGEVAEFYNHIEVVIDGATQLLSSVCFDGVVGSPTHVSSSLNLQNPILLDQGSTIVLTQGNSNGVSSAVIVGYTE